MAVKYPPGFREVTGRENINLKKGDEILYVFKRPSWLPKNTSKLYNEVIAHKPGSMDITKSFGGKQHGMSLCRVWTTENEAYFVYVMTTNFWPIVIAVGGAFLVGLALGFILKRPIATAICQMAGEGLAVLFALVFLGLGGFLGVKYLLRRFG